MSTRAATAASVEAARAVARADIYALLARAFQAPSDTFLSDCAAGGIGSRLSAARAVLGQRGLAGAFDEFAAAAAAAGPGLPADHVRVFGYVNSLVCPPYETEYTAEHIFMKTSQMADVAGFYQAFGLQMGEALGERPDHVVAELEFMQVLALKEALALERGETEHALIARRAQRLFLRDHLARWAPAFAERVVSQAGDGTFYAVLAGLLRAFVSRDASRLRVQPRPLTRDARFEAPPGPMECPFGEESWPDPSGAEVSDAVQPAT